MANRKIAGGAWVRIVADGTAIGLVSGASYDEDFGVRPVAILNHQGPADYDSQDYSCSLSIQAFVPEPSQLGPWPDGASKSFKDLIPTRSKVQSNLGKPGQIDVLQFVSTSSDKVLNQFETVMISRDGGQIVPNSFVTGNIQLLAVERTI